MWLVVGSAALGGALGALATPVTRQLLTSGNRPRWALAPALVVVTAAVFGLLAWRLGPGVDLVAYGCLAFVGLPLATIDLIEQRLPRSLVVPLYPALVGLFGLAAFLGHEPARLLRAVLGMIILLVFYLVIALLARGGLGSGDVRLAGVLGLALAWRGWIVLASGTLLALFYAAIAGAILIALQRAHRRTPVPFGPALVAGAFTALLVPVG